jgi:methionyl-tRNA formyltransferase
VIFFVYRYEVTNIQKKITFVALLLVLEFGQKEVFKLRVVFMGTPEFAVPCLEHLVLNGHEVVAVYTQPDKPAGRGSAPVLSPVKKVAQAMRIPVLQPASLKGSNVVGQLAGFHPDVVVVAAYGQVLPQQVLDIPRRGCINIHPSLLPKYRGASPVTAAILAGDEFAGMSIMLMDRGLDTGPILSRAMITISAQDTTESVTAKLSQVSARMLEDTLVGWARGEIVPQPQNEAEATYSPQISKEDGEVNWGLPAIEVWHRVRAYYPWPGCYTRWQGKQLKIIEAVPLPGEKTAEAGRIVALAPAEGKAEAAFGVHTGEGILGVIKVQLEGKRAMSAAEFLRGQRNFIGAMLPSD